MAGSVFVTGATGLVGRALCLALAEAGVRVRALTRRSSTPDIHPAITWIRGDLLQDDDWRTALVDAEAVVHLAGESIADGRWSDERKQELVASRVESTRRVVAALDAHPQRPRVMVCASACGYYGPRGEEVLDESSAPGSDFLARLCVDWEAAARTAEPLGHRVVVLRFGMILSAEGGALARMLPIFRAGLGGPLGPARLYTPWIHIDDVVALIRHALEDGEAPLSGPVNAVSPGVVRMGDFASALGRAVGRWSLLPVPLPVLRLVLGEATDAVVPGQHVVPRAACESGFEFRFTRIEPALRSLVS